ncbi:NAD(P)-dependent oxidoreductase [Pseudonocardia sichuanensis]
MRLTVFGATGGTGRQLVRLARAEGHEVVPVVRRPQTVEGVDGVVADVFDPRSVAPALAGSDAAVSTLGPRGRSDRSGVCSRAISSILSAMEDVGVRRIVAVSAQPVLRSGAGEPAWHRATLRPLVRAVYRTVYADLERMEQVLAAGRADWTVVRPPYLTDGPATGAYRSALEANVPGGSISRADLARALLDVLDDPVSVRHAIGVARAAM